jgi:hypothetical protein
MKGPSGSFQNSAVPGTTKSSVPHGLPNVTIRQLQLRGSPPPSGSLGDTAGADMAPITSFGTSPWMNDLRIPDGRKIGDLEHGEVYAVLGSLGIDGFSHNLGRIDAIPKYADHLQSIHDEAGRAAVTAWLAANRSI